ncbi:hypothetical protein ACHAXH_007366 [Discostella pseudostelligera]
MMNQVKRTTSKVKTRLHIRSATYGPADGRKLYDGKLVDYDQRREETYVPNSRDVLPFLRVLMSASSSSPSSAEMEDYLFEDGECDVADAPTDNEGQVLAGTSNYYASCSRNAFPLMDGRPMNAVFGDPCPGTTKLLHVEYLFRDYFYEDDASTSTMAATVAATVDDQGKVQVVTESNDSEGRTMAERNARRSHFHCTTSRIFTSIFREHERVVLKRQDPLFRLDTTASGDDDESNYVSPPKLLFQQQMSDDGGDYNNTMQVDGAAMLISPSQPKQQWKLAPTTSEITLPIILPFLTVRQRAKCQLVCTSWKDIVLEKGIAVVVDINDVGLFPKSSTNIAPPTTASSSISTTYPFMNITPNIHSSSLQSSSSSAHNNDHHSSRSLLRGLLNHSHSSLEALVLNDFISLQPTMDLHPALPFLRKLQRLDISRIPTITDETLRLISTYVGPRLEVLYMKGLRQVTNDGIVYLVQSCCNLRVLDVSQVHQLDDEAGIVIGRYLTKLEVLHGKDNYKLTNRSVDLITRNCRNLVQVTLWGSIRLTHISFHDDKLAEDGGAEEASDTGGESISKRAVTTVPAMHLQAPIITPSPMKLVLLNLWGCHNLTDATAQHLTGLPFLRSLCVSECHRLTDQFVYGISKSLPRLLHLQLRYVRRITDASLKSISQCMPWLYSLDVSFCTQLTIEGVSQLLIERCNSLSELRLYSCRNLNIEATNDGRDAGGAPRIVSGGRQLARALQTVRGASILSFLDLRECQQHESFSRDASWLEYMVELGFNESLHGLFIRPASWNDDVRKQLVTNVAF